MYPAKANRRHLYGTIMMWGGVGLAAVFGLAVVPSHPVAGVIGFVGGFAGAIAGAVLKKVYCPQCRSRQCTVSQAPPAQKD